MFDFSRNSVFVWGDGADGQLGLNEKKLVKTPTRNNSCEGLGVTWCQVGPCHSAVVSDSGLCYVMGNNDFGQLGKPDLKPRLTARLAYDFTPPGLRVRSIACGLNHSLVVVDNGLFSFGQNSAGQLGVGSLESHRVPVRVDAFGDRAPAGSVMHVAAGTNISLVVTQTGTVFSFGDGAYGLLGNGNAPAEYNHHLRLLPEPIDSSTGLDDSQMVHKVAVGQQHALALTAAGTVWTWGLKNLPPPPPAQTDVGALPRQVVFDTVEGERNPLVVCIDAGSYHSAAVTESGCLWAWGSGYHGQLGLGVAENRQNPTLVHLPLGVTIENDDADNTDDDDDDDDDNDDDAVVQVACGHLHTVVRCRSGRLFVMGFKDALASSSSNGNAVSPVEVKLPLSGGLSEGRRPIHISAGGHATAVVVGTLSRRLPDPPHQLPCQPCSAASPLQLNVFVGTWNVNGQSPPANLGDWLLGTDADHYPDLLIIGVQELVGLSAGNVARSTAASATTAAKTKADSLKSRLKGLSVGGGLRGSSPGSQAAKNWEIALTHRLEADSGGCLFTKVAAKQLVGVWICVYVKRDLFDIISEVKVSSCPVGLGGKVGNKGAVAVRFRIGGVKLCAVCAHTAAGESTEKLEKRCQDLFAILQGGISFDVDQGLDGRRQSTALDHDYCFFLGDFNFRMHSIEKPDLMDTIASIVSRSDEKDVSVDGAADDNKVPSFAALAADHDELLLVQRLGRVLGWHEGPIKFPPTYKFDPGTDDWDTSAKGRKPAWCDRILFRPSSGLQLTSYIRCDSLKDSDHRPVSARFILNAYPESHGAEYAPPVSGGTAIPNAKSGKVTTLRRMKNMLHATGSQNAAGVSTASMMNTDESRQQFAAVMERIRQRDSSRINVK